MQFSDGNNSGDRGTTDGTRGVDLRAMAVLDALGMLDEVEAAQFDRAFRDASPSLQAELRNVQAKAAVDPAFLGSDEPAPELRLKTLAAVMTAVERQESSLAPIAHIGRTAARADRRPVRSIDANELVQQAMEVASLRKDVERFTRSAYYWRAASIALIAALTAALAFQLATARSAMQISEGALGRATPEQIFESIGEPDALSQFEGASLRRTLSGQAGEFFSVAVVGGAGGEGRVLGVGIGLEKGTEYVLRHVAENGAVSVIGTFVAQRSAWGVSFSVPGTLVAMLPAGRIELVPTGGPDVAARSLRTA